MGIIERRPALVSAMLLTILEHLGFFMYRRMHLDSSLESINRNMFCQQLMLTSTLQKGFVLK